eukprot:932963-Pyramimonas_sp.AAC.1
MSDRAAGEPPSVTPAVPSGTVDDIVIERPVLVLPGVCCKQLFDARDQLDDASFLPPFASEVASNLTPHKYSC